MIFAEWLAAGSHRGPVATRRRALVPIRPVDTTWWIAGDSFGLDLGEAVHTTVDGDELVIRWWTPASG